MPTIDADTHVVESEDVWAYFDSDGLARPILAIVPEPRTGKSQTRWVIDGKLIPKPEGRGSQGLATPPLEGESGDAGDVLWSWRSLADPVGRAADHKARGVDVQVVFPTIFLADLTEDPALQVALAHAYNRFMADRWSKAQESLRWAAVLPFRSVADAVTEAEYAASHGAVGILFHGVEGDRSLGDPYFHPIYGAAERLGLAICVHTGPGSPTILNLQDNRFTRNFGQNRVLPLIGFHDLVFTRVPELFPQLRIGFLEASASWVPFLLHFFRRAAKRSGRDRAFFGPQLFEDYRIYVACESDEDIPYLAEHIGWDHLMIGSDYAHTDQSAELEIVETISTRPDIDAANRHKMLEDNPARFYGLAG